MTRVAIDPVRYPLITLINADYHVLTKRMNYKRAGRLLFKGLAVVETEFPGMSLGLWPYPEVLRLATYVKVPYSLEYATPGLSKRNVLLRDKYKCAYCGSFGDTIDHVLPRSRGGMDTWENLVAACFSCNNRKDDRTPKEAGMTLLKQPWIPRKSDLR